VEHRIAFKVYYEDTDSLGVVYYANYFKYFERGRSEFIGTSGREISDWNAAGYVFVVHSLEAQFRRSLALGETFDVVTTLEVPSPYRCRFQQRIERQGELCVKAQIDIACLDAAGGLIEVPAQFRAMAVEPAAPLRRPGG
jgi:acyl-CoA thioester hydrolase